MIPCSGKYLVGYMRQRVARRSSDNCRSGTASADLRRDLLDRSAHAEGDTVRVTDRGQEAGYQTQHWLAWLTAPAAPLWIAVALFSWGAAAHAALPAAS